MWKKTLEDLGFAVVLQEIMDCALSEEGRSLLSQAHFTNNIDKLSKRQQLVVDILSILGSGNAPAPDTFPSLTEVFDVLAQKGASLSGEQLYQVGEYIGSAVSLRAFLHKPIESLTANGNPQQPNPASYLIQELPSELLSLRDELTKTLDAPGVVKESHPAIRSLMKEIEQKRSERTRYSAEFMRTHSSVMQNDQPVYRDGRVVMPVRNDQRQDVQGFLLGSSSSGNTVFMEPYKLVELNNSVVMAEQQVLIEIARIIGELSRKVREVEDLLRLLTVTVRQADELYACARWALRNKCVPTDLQGNVVRLIDARHPLLRKKAVPITMVLEPNVQAVVVSGPNAGGKTVTIKTVGLLALLNQFCGCIPAAEGSALPLFDGIYTDIGDDQSIEAQLSTFSGHMKQTGQILNAATPQSLVILDELGSGTDPVEGAAIARAVMEYSVQHARLTLVTSHHGVLKQYAYASENVLNASMEFDERTHAPTFHVISGVPGESHAVDTAKRMHLPESVIRAAQGYLGDESVQISVIIKGLEQRRIEAEEREQQLQQRYMDLQKQVKEVELKRLKVDQQENLVRKEQLGDLRSFISQKRSELENLVADLRQGEITREKTKKVQAFISSMQEKEAEAARRQDEKEQIVARAELAKVGKIVFAPNMDVLCGNSKREGRILRADGKGKWIVAIGPMKFSLKESELSLPKRGQESQRVSVSYQSSAPRPKLTLDVRGMNLEQALQEVAVQVEACIVHDIGSFSIIHGYGDGILSRGICQYLDSLPAVTGRHFALPEDGGMGKTYVDLT